MFQSVCYCLLLLSFVCLVARFFFDVVFVAVTRVIITDVVCIVSLMVKVAVCCSHRGGNSGTKGPAGWLYKSQTQRTKTSEVGDPPFIYLPPMSAWQVFTITPVATPLHQMTVVPVESRRMANPPGDAKDATSTGHI